MELPRVLCCLGRDNRVGSRRYRVCAKEESFVARRPSCELGGSAPPAVLRPAHSVLSPERGLESQAAIAVASKRLLPDGVARALHWGWRRIPAIRDSDGDARSCAVAVHLPDVVSRNGTTGKRQSRRPMGGGGLDDIDARRCGMCLHPALCTCRCLLRPRPFDQGNLLTFDRCRRAVATLAHPQRARNGRP